MKNYKSALLLFVVVLFLALSCKKDNASSNILKLTAADTGKTITISSGQTISLTLSNPGDGLYDFVAPQCDTTVLRLDKHIHTPPTDSRVMGDFGKDTFEFIPLKIGTTTLTVGASRGGVTTNTAISMFSATINVQ